MKYIGIDCGSTACKLVVIDNNMKIIFKQCKAVYGNVIETVVSLISSLTLADDQKYIVGVTGSSRILIAKYLRTNLVKSELIAHTLGTLELMPNVGTIIEIGGQDSKLITVENMMIKDFQLNSVCAAGTGAFLESQSYRLGLKIEEFDLLAKKSSTLLPLIGKCSVFVESAMINQQKLGAKKEDIAYSLCVAMAKNYISELIKGRSLRKPIVIQGGVARISSVVSALEKELETEIQVMPFCEYMGAYGMAIFALRSQSNETIDLHDFSDESDNITVVPCSCEDCTNRCDVSDYYFDKQFGFRIGGRCGKYN